MTVTELLTQSRAAHQRYRAASGRIATTGKIAQAPNLRACGAAVQEALASRLDAHKADPLKADPAWIEDEQAMKGATSDSLVEFYAAYLSRAQVA